MLRDDRVRRFVEDGFVGIDEAFPREIAGTGLGALRQPTGFDPPAPSPRAATIRRSRGQFHPYLPRIRWSHNCCIRRADQATQDIWRCI